jgi:hypothetical protein
MGGRPLTTFQDCKLEATHTFNTFRGDFQFGSFAGMQINLRTVIFSVPSKQVLRNPEGP